MEVFFRQCQRFLQAQQEEDFPVEVSAPHCPRQ